VDDKTEFTVRRARQTDTLGIEGLDRQADGGMHTANTGEVGPLRIVEYRSKGRVNKRLLVTLE
jgi:misacylated tRNA(Ala) deacylase